MPARGKARQDGSRFKTKMEGGKDDKVRIAEIISPYGSWEGRLEKGFGENLLGAVTGHPVTVTAHDAAVAIHKDLAGDVSLDTLTDWVNTIWFTDLYAYDDAESDCIGSVMAVLETLDEDGVVVTQKGWEEMLKCFRTNAEYSGR